MLSSHRPSPGHQILPDTSLYVQCHLHVLLVGMPKRVEHPAEGLLVLYKGYRTFQYQNTSVSNHFGTSVLGPKWPDQFGTSAGVSPDTSASAPKCLRTLRYWVRSVCNHFGTGTKMSRHFGLIGMETIRTCTARIFIDKPMLDRKHSQ